MRHAARADNNKGDIVSALRKIGAKVYDLKRPLDLLVGFRGRNILIEVKNRDGFNRNTEAQKEFIAGWPGEIHTVYTAAEAVAAVVGKEAMA